MSTHIAYIEQGKRGRVGALDYLVGTIVMFLAWIIFQGVFQVPILFLDPDMMQELMAEAQAGAAAAPDPQSAGGFPFGALLGLGLLLSTIAYLVHRTTAGGASRAAGVVSWVGVVMVLVGVVPLVAAVGSGGDEATTEAFTALLGGSVVAYGLTLASFIGGILGAWFATRAIHGRTFRSLITAAERIRWSRMVWVFAMTLGLWSLINAVMVFTGLTEVMPNPRASQMLPFLVATVLFIPIQCAAEEVMFRGYLNQALGRFVPSAVVVVLLTSLLFGAMHLANPEIATAKEDGTFVLAFGFYVLFGVVFSVLVWIDNGLEAAIGVHTANNLFVATFINMEGSALPIPGMWLAVVDESGEAVSGLSFLVSMGLVLAGVWLTRRAVVPAASPLAVEPSVVDDPDRLEDVFTL